MLLLVLSVLSIYTATGNECTQKCDFTYHSGRPVTFCGIDGLTYNTTFDAMDNEDCYAACGVDALYQGICGCPSECNEAFSQGSCKEEPGTGQFSCVCTPGWGGYDCSLPAQSNSCGFHGTLVEATSKDSVFPFDYCECETGWTGTDCSTEKPNVGNAPWDTIFPSYASSGYYTNDAKYGDKHPIFDVEKLPTIRITISQEDLVYLLTPANLFSEKYIPATFYWQTGDKDEATTVKQVGFKVKGAQSKLHQKKGWYIKFNEFVSGQSFYDMKKVGLKPCREEGDVFLKNFIYQDFVRAIGSPVHRHNYALLYINDIYYGLFILHEDLDSDFLKQRIENDDGTGNLMKLYFSAHLGYFGNDTSYYQNRAHINALGDPMYYYQAAQDPKGTLWQDFVGLLYYFNVTSGKEFEDSINTYVNLEGMINLLIVESFVLASDQMNVGNNYYFYQRNQKDSPQKQWIVFYSDFDSLLKFSPISSNVPKENPGVISFYDPSFDRNNEYDDYNPLIDQILHSSKLVDTYMKNYRHFLDEVFGSNSKQQPTARYTSLLNFISPWVGKDRLWQFCNDITADEFFLNAKYSMQHLNWRYQNASAQLKDYFATKRH